MVLSGGARRRSWAQAPRRKYIGKNIYTEFCDSKKKLVDRWRKCIGKQGDHVEK